MGVKDSLSSSPNRYGKTTTNQNLTAAACLPGVFLQGLVMSVKVAWPFKLLPFRNNFNEFMCPKGDLTGYCPIPPRGCTFTCLSVSVTLGQSVSAS